MATAFRDLIRPSAGAELENQLMYGSLSAPEASRVNAQFRTDLDSIFKTEPAGNVWTGPGALTRKSWTSPLFLTIPFSTYVANRDDPHHASIEARVDDLRNDAANEDEAFSEPSAGMLLQFCHDLAADIEPAIFRLANGNLRALWQNGIKDQIGIQFLPDAQLQFVILRDRRGRTYKTLGIEDSDTIRQIVDALKLNDMWFNG